MDPLVPPGSAGTPRETDRPHPMAAPEPPPPPVPRLGRVAQGLAALALLAFLVAGVLVVLPVRTPEVQDCGTPAAYLLGGRIDLIPDQDGRIPGPDGEAITVTPEAAQAARDRPCQPRIADRAVPALVLAVAGTLVGIGAFALELLVVRPRRRRALLTGSPDRRP